MLDDELKAVRNDELSDDELEDVSGGQGKPEDTPGNTDRDRGTFPGRIGPRGRRYV